jgi:hypothetical protein
VAALHLANDTSAYGKYLIRGDELLLYGEAGPGIVELVRAEIHPHVIEFRDNTWHYRFAR